MAVPENIISPGPADPAQAEAAMTINDCVKCGTAEGKFVKTAGDNEAGAGFTNIKATADGDGIGIVSSGVVWARAAAPISYGDKLMSAADGEVKTVGTTAATTYNIVGEAWGAAAGENELLPVKVQIYQVTTPA